MKNTLLALMIAAVIAPPGFAAESGPSVERYYCTQFGPFFIRFDADKAAGVFAILPNNDLGSIVGELSGRDFSGEWIETDSRGEIRLKFSEDWLYFDAEYSVAPANETWLGDWSGRIRPANNPATFEYNGVTYRCE